MRCPEPTKTWVDCYGKFTYDDGSVYLGMVKLDKSHGPGQRTFANGDRYVGEFQADDFHGQGVYSYADGRKFDGNFKNGKRHGAGIEYSSRGLIVRRGNWNDGEFVVEGNPTQRAVSASAPARAKDLYIEVTNNTGYTIQYLYVRPAGGAGRGSDRLGSGQVLNSGAAITVKLPMSEVEYFDVIACDRETDEYLLSGVNAVTSDARLEYSHRTFNKCP